jgi:hypothetical protein
VEELHSVEELQWRSFSGEAGQFTNLHPQDLQRVTTSTCSSCVGVKAKVLLPAYA